jgi:membrane protease YdiL (CAAX protease family)
MGDIGRLLHGYGKSAVGQVWDLSGKGSLREAFKGTSDDFSIELEGDVEREKWKTWGLVILSWLCMIIAPLIFSIGTIIILLSLGLSEDMTVGIVGVLAYVLMFFIVIAFLYIDGRLDTFWKLFDVPPLKKTLVLVIFVSVIDFLLVMAYAIGYDFIAGSPEEVELFFDPGSANNLLILALLFTTMSIGAPLVEEMYFRGYILNSLRGMHSDNVAIIVSGLLFGIIHNPFFLFFGGIYQIGVTSIGGFLYAWLRIRTGSLWPSIACHFLWNTMIFVLMFA